MRNHSAKESGLPPTRLSRRSLLATFGGFFVAAGAVACQTVAPSAVATRATAAPARPTARPTSVATPRVAVAAATPRPRSTNLPTPGVTRTPIVSATVPFPTEASPRPSATIPFDSNPEHLQPNGPPHDPGPLTWAKPGPHLGSAFDRFEIQSFRAAQPLITTYYFYWHDLTDPARQQRIRTTWTESPPDPAHYSFLNVSTHLQQFQDMQAAGLDFVLPVYWGEPGHPGRAFNPTPGHFWSTEGIPPMVAALDEMASAGRPFKLGMFYDTTILANADLTTENGKAYFYVNVRDFYSKIPPRHWAAIDNKPIVWLYDTQWVSRFDQSSFDDLSARFASDFGGLRPYVVREWEWYRSKGVTPSQIIHSDNLYGWGAAPSGFNTDPRFGVAEVGPGFNNTGFCHGGVSQNCFDIDRQNGTYYARQWQQALRSGRKLAAVETWNEFSEGSGIAESVQYGRLYLDLTRKYADAYHARRTSVS